MSQKTKTYRIEEILLGQTRNPGRATDILDPLRGGARRGVESKISYDMRHDLLWRTFFDAPGVAADRLRRAVVEEVMDAPERSDRKET